MKYLVFLIMIASCLLVAGPSVAYVLQAENLAKDRGDFIRIINECGRQLIIIDHSFDGGRKSLWSPQELSAMKSSDSKRKILAYLSIGEAEDYRFYWKKEWKSKRPAFLLSENREWRGNFHVRYWDEEWQKIVTAYLVKIIQQGFDGVYLDIVDGYEFFEKGKDNCLNPMTKRSYRDDMKAFVLGIVRKAKRQSSGFMVFQQNAQALFEDGDYLSQLDGIGAEDVFTDGRRRQKEGDFKEAIQYLKKAQTKGLQVFLIEYPADKQLRHFIRSNAAKYGLATLVTDRELTTLGEFFAPAH